MIGLSNLIGGLVSTVTDPEVWTVVLLEKSVAEIIRFRCILVIKANLKEKKIKRVWVQHAPSITNIVQILKNRIKRNF